jgi:drug/metabolite transporter (DMT)-like permease
VVAVFGWPLHAFALTRAPLTVVQPMLAVGLVVPLAFGARMLGEHVHRRDVLDVATIAVGVSLLVVVAPPRRMDTALHQTLAVTLVALAGTLVASLVVTAAVTRWRESLLVFAAGIGFALSAITTKLLADSLSRNAWATAVAWLAATIAAGGIGLAAEMSALQIRATNNVATLVFALETVVPVALSPVLFGETGTGSASTLALRAIALVLILAAAVGLTRSRLVVKALAEE